MLLIKNGYVINPMCKQVKMCKQEEICKQDECLDILIKGDKIVKIGRLTEKEIGVWGDEEVQVIDASGMIVAPGLVDVHVHFRDPGFTHKEDILSGAASAAKGGFTTVVLMANTKPCVDNEETLLYILDKGKKTGLHIETCANVTMGMQGKELTDMSSLSKAGAVGFTDDGIPLLEEKIVLLAMNEAARLKKPLSFHEENPAYIENNGINTGIASYYKIGGSDRKAEIEMVRRDLDLAKGTGADISIQHISTKEAVELVRRAKMTNPHIHAEATPHHFTLTQEAVMKHGTLAKMNPPLREEEDRLAIIEGLRDGTIDMIATDHAPHSEEEKKNEITKAPSGIIGLETSLSLGIRELVNKGYLTMAELMDRMSAGPAKLYHLDAGYLEVDGPADMVIFNQEETWKAGDYASKSSNSPFTGEVLPGVVHYTICGGKIVYRND